MTDITSASTEPVELEAQAGFSGRVVVGQVYVNDLLRRIDAGLEGEGQLGLVSFVVAVHVEDGRPVTLGLLSEEVGIVNLGEDLLLVRADGPVEPWEIDAVRALCPVGSSARAEVFGRCGVLVDAAFGLVMPLVWTRRPCFGARGRPCTRFP